MNQWRIHSKETVIQKVEARIARSAKIHPKSTITGKVFISENANVGISTLTADDGYSITVGKDTTIKDGVLISPKDSNGHELTYIKDVLIGHRVFISGDVYIYGPTMISDGVFIGYNTKIVNCKIGSNCVIEDNVIIKDINIPPDTFIPAKSIIDSKEKLNEFILCTAQGNFCEYEIPKNSVFAHAS